jgi:hypothetical protein
LLNRNIARPALKVLALVLLTALATGCAGESDSTTESDGVQSVHGRIVDLNSRSLLELESVTIRSESGETYTVEAGGVALGQFTPSHLREHMVSGLEVVVTYHDESGRLVLDAISD